jgi:hypothetical protein
MLGLSWRIEFQAKARATARRGAKVFCAAEVKLEKIKGPDRSIRAFFFFLGGRELHARS